MIKNIIVGAHLLLNISLVWSQGIMKVKEINPTGHATSQSPFIWKAMGKMFFLADDGVKKGLWVSDGTDAGTQFVEEFIGVSHFKEFNGKLFFSGYQNSQIGEELYVTDGTTSGTALYKDIRPNGGSNPQHLHVYNGYLYFQANNGADGEELWRTDGNPNNTFMWLDFQLGSNGGIPKNFFNYMGKMYFGARTQSLGAETLWVSDGEVMGTDFFVDSAINPKNFFVMKDTMYFTAKGDHIYKSDGTKQGTFRIADIHPTKGNDCDYFAVLNNKFYFVAESQDKDYEMWVSDGTPSGTYLFYEFDINNTVFYPRYLHAHQGKIYFAALHPSLGYELWSTNGTAVGTSLLKDINPNGSSHPQFFLSVNNDLYFIAYDGVKSGLWKTNGTTSGTFQYDVPFATKANYSISSPPIEYNGSIYFFADFDNSGRELYKLDLASEIGDGPIEYELKLYPNPAKDVLCLANSEKVVSLTVTDFLGRTMLTQWRNDQQSMQIDIGHLPASPYFINFMMQNGETVVKRFVKQ